jgi:hypothetical protein
VSTPPTLTDTERAELEWLRGRVAELEAERIEELRRAAAAVTAARERAYWLDRWHVDLNALMARPAATRVRSAARLVRAPIRALRSLTRRLLGR